MNFKEYAFALVVILISCNASAQNAFNFDGIDDFGAAPNGSSLIANSSGMSLSMWVYPTATPPGYPDFGGMAGFRNETNCDFYLLQLGGTNLEGRVRTNSGVFTLSASNILNINTWNHFVLTYNGSNLTLYHNGTMVTTTPASGTISNTSTPFNVGYVPFGAANFYFEGSLDDVALWDVALTSSEVTSLYNACSANSQSSDLKILYEFNQGIAGGNNSSILSFTDTKGSNNATISGASMSGNLSNFVAGVAGQGSDSISTTSCGPYEYTSPNGNVTYTSSGVYRDTIITSNGCDSIFTLNLTVIDIDTTVTAIGDTLLISNDSLPNISYRWLSCDTQEKIIGAVNRSFAPYLAGSYAVILTRNGCVDTSECVLVNLGIGVNELTSLPLEIYPNPSSGLINIKTTSYAQLERIALLDISGRLIMEINVSEEVTQLRVDDLLPGLYFLRLSDHRGEYRIEKISIH